MKKFIALLTLALCISCGNGAQRSAAIRETPEVGDDSKKTKSQERNAINLFTTCETIEALHPNTDIDDIINLDIENNEWRTDIEFKTAQYIMNLYRSISDESFNKDSPIKIKDAKLKVDANNTVYIFAQVGLDTEQEKYEFLILQDSKKNLVHFNFAFKSDTQCLDTQHSVNDMKLALEFSHNEKLKLLVSQQKVINDSTKSLGETKEQAEIDRLNKLIEDTTKEMGNTLQEIEKIKQTAKEIGFEL